MLSLTAVMPPHKIDHDADGDDDQAPGRPAENAEPANIGDHKQCDTERHERRRRCRQGKARSVGHISHSSSPSRSIPVAGTRKTTAASSTTRKSTTDATISHLVPGATGSCRYQGMAVQP